ncbi:hypothetical protein ANN_20260 [Periplaneta americana]|uniref:Uncharacterized protein n=1 Tax=Periplaneta americana TaxID=6978 RepID=A0ABQ8SDA5_PERAM|nr:hypothetical protein ANN_20260 [Periplaneta americana]
MTFGLLGRGATPADGHLETTGPSAMGDPEVLHYVERGSYGASSGGWKGGKGNQSAMSALTLLAFLFFLNLLQSCLKESMNPTGTAMLMMMPANRTGALVRPARDVGRRGEGDWDYDDEEDDVEEEPWVWGALRRLGASLSPAPCCELVVCEAHRAGGVWGAIGEAVAWRYGVDAGLVAEAAATGRARRSCSVQMQRCEDASHAASALPLVATVLEQLL